VGKVEREKERKKERELLGKHCEGCILYVEMKYELDSNRSRAPLKIKREPSPERESKH
jgi:hypothetical protein